MNFTPEDIQQLQFYAKGGRAPGATAQAAGMGALTGGVLTGLGAPALTALFAKLAGAQLDPKAYLLAAGLGGLSGAGLGALGGAIRGGGARGGFLAPFNSLPGNMFEGGSDNAMYGLQQLLAEKGVY